VADILAAMGPADPAVQEETVRILQGQGQTASLGCGAAADACGIGGGVGVCRGGPTQIA
jgi:hypothetical protein